MDFLDRFSTKKLLLIFVILGLIFLGFYLENIDTKITFFLFAFFIFTNLIFGEWYEVDNEGYVCLYFLVEDIFGISYEDFQKYFQMNSEEMEKKFKIKIKKNGELRIHEEDLSNFVKFFKKQQKRIDVFV